MGPSSSKNVMDSQSGLIFYFLAQDNFLFGMSTKNVLHNFAKKSRITDY